MSDLDFNERFSIERINLTAVFLRLRDERENSGDIIKRIQAPISSSKDSRLFSVSRANAPLTSSREE
jgi:hypothetical protein